MAVLSRSRGVCPTAWTRRVVRLLGHGADRCGLALLALVGPGRPYAFVMACLVLLGAGFGLFSSPNTNAVMGSVEKRSYGVAAATLATMRLVGQMLSMGVASLVLAVFVGPEAVGPARGSGFVAGMRAAFGLYALVCVAGVFASLARGARARLSAGAVAVRVGLHPLPGRADDRLERRLARQPAEHRVRLSWRCRRAAAGRPRAAGPSRTARRGR